MTAKRFFDEYPQFLTSSETGADADRLNGRYEAIIEANRDIIEGRSILDIASHDGRWSFAALHAGAKNVTGIEIRPHLIEHSLDHLAREPDFDGRFDIVGGDALETLGRLEPGRFDTVFCLGYLYHTVHTAKLIQEIGRLRPRHLILDTQLGIPAGMHEPADWMTLSKGRYGAFFMKELCAFLSAQPIIFLHEDETACEGMAVYQDEEAPFVPVGYPTKGAVEFLLAKAGFGNFRYGDWLDGDRDVPDALFDYRMGYRVTLRCEAL